MLVDSHCHLDFPDFAAELPEVVARARAAGVTHCVTISTRLSAFEQVRSIAEQFDGITCSVGVHPLEAAAEPDVTTAQIVELTHHPKVVAIGETGLDYHYDPASRDVQIRDFRAHIGAARETGLPLVIHARDADEDVAAILEEETAKGRFPFLLHCFTAGPELARRALALGGYISFSGIITFKKSQDLRDIAASVPEDRILVETDSPYLAPTPHRGKRNEPSFVRETAKVLAEARGASLEEVAQATTRNFFTLFSKAKS
ncbi:TatD family hydrolase [Xanthobacter sp. TB0139]|uniref:TatD family hydrolase n=1 Tax=Xanthobacter sp. TB0139 TaxID=3459178 RepID=UPI00403A3CF4